MSGINTRIWVKHEKGADIFCTTDPEVMKDVFGSTSTMEEGATFPMDRGDGEEEYEVVEVRTKSYSETRKNSGEYGYSMYNVGDRYPYDMDITYIVRQV